jgi:hypothetical protein
MAWRVLVRLEMQPNDLHVQTIDLQDLESVRGGFGALLGALLQAAPGILQGVGGIIAASKSGGGGGGAPSGGPSGATAQASAGGQPPAQATASAASGSPCAGGCCQMAQIAPMRSMSQMVQIA